MVDLTTATLREIAEGVTPLSCPFCGPQDEGQQPVFSAIADVTDGFEHSCTIFCPSCAIEMSEQDKGDLLKLWNARPELTRLREQLEAASQDFETANARVLELEGCLLETAAVLQAEKGRMGGEPFTGTWSFPSHDLRVTCSGVLDRADAALGKGGE